MLLVGLGRERGELTFAISRNSLCPVGWIHWNSHPTGGFGADCAPSIL